MIDGTKSLIGQTVVIAWPAIPLALVASVARVYEVGPVEIQLGKPTARPEVVDSLRVRCPTIDPRVAGLLAVTADLGEIVSQCVSYAPPVSTVQVVPTGMGGA